jgi:hypothetical protein
MYHYISNFIPKKLITFSRAISTSPQVQGFFSFGGSKTTNDDNEDESEEFVDENKFPPKGQILEKVIE